MKESDYRRKELEEVDEHDSDFKYFNREAKLHKALKAEKFEEVTIQEILNMGFDVKQIPNGWAITIRKGDVCEYYPKSGSVFFKGSKKWKKKIGYPWLKKFVLEKYKKDRIGTLLVSA